VKMAYYHQCPRCNCNLDPGEKCDCRKEELKKEQFFKKITRIDSATGQMVFRWSEEKVECGNGMYQGKGIGCG